MSDPAALAAFLDALGVLDADAAAAPDGALRLAWDGAGPRGRLHAAYCIMRQLWSAQTQRRHRLHATLSWREGRCALQPGLARPPPTAGDVAAAAAAAARRAMSHTASATDRPGGYWCCAGTRLSGFAAASEANYAALCAAGRAALDAPPGPDGEPSAAREAGASDAALACFVHVDEHLRWLAAWPPFLAGEPPHTLWRKLPPRPVS